MSVFDVEVRGEATGPFAAMNQIFARSLGAQGAGGAQLSVYHRGKKVVDLTGGDFAHDSVMLVFSVTKAIVAMATHHAISAGALRLDMHLHEVWPAFTRSERARAITLEHVLDHSAGLASVERALTVDEHIAGAVRVEIEAQEPLWEPGSTHGYHALTFGALIDGVFEHALGTTVAEYIRTHLVEPLGLDLSLAVAPEQVARVRRYRRPRIAVTPLERNVPADALPDGAGANIWSDMLVFNRDDVLDKPWGSTNVVTGARDLAKLFASAIGEVEGTRVLDERALELMTEVRFRGIDRMLGFPIAFGRGVQLPFPQFAMTGPGSFGHEGAGGSFVVADPKRELSIGYITDAYPASNGAAAPSYALLSALALIVDELQEGVHS